MKRTMKTKLIVIMVFSLTIALVLFLSEHVLSDRDGNVQRNVYGEGDKTEEYVLTVEGEVEDRPFHIQVEEQEYSKEETKELFEEVLSKLDKVILGENESFDRVEKDLNLVNSLEDYPVQIEWQLDSYLVMNLYGEIQEENLVPEGSLVEIRGIVSYKDEECAYVQYARIYPLTRTGVDKLLYEVENEIRSREEQTREDVNFALPKEVGGRKLEWRQKKEARWHYVLLAGAVLCAYLVYRDKERIKTEKKRRKEELEREFPGLISRFTMLISTGTTVRNAWEKLVQSYEAQKEQLGVRIAYEEMSLTLREIQGGVSEAEAYERFGKRCGITTYLKFGTLLSQNLRKGSKGMAEILRIEAIQTFENRKNKAKRLGEEAGTKLLMPMLGMLAVVFIIVMVPAFLSMQL